MVPEGWEKIAVRKLLESQTPGYWGSVLHDGEIGTAVLRATNIRDDGFLDFADVAYRDVPPRKIQQKRLRHGDILLENSGGGANKPVGRVAIFEKESDEPFLPTNFLRRLRPDRSRIDSRFLLYLLWRFHRVGGTKAFQHQTTGIRNLNYREYLSREHPVPPISEQRKITAILSSVDDSIVATRKIIEQTNRVKRGLLQSLMTRGIGHARFKKSEIGEIPEEWEVVRLGQLYTERKEAGRPGLPVMSVTLDQGLVPRDSLDRRVESELRPSEHALVGEGDLVYNTMRMWQGGSGVADCECVVSPAYVVAKPCERISPYFARYLFKAPATIDRLFSFSQGITLDRLRLYFDNFSQIPAPLPPLGEQARIAAVLDRVDSVLKSEAATVQDLGRVKRGLMQDLLTGRVRVQPD